MDTSFYRDDLDLADHLGGKILPNPRMNFEWTYLPVEPRTCNDDAHICHRHSWIGLFGIFESYIKSSIRS